MFIGRKEELEALNKRYLSNKFEFGYLYGQRRIGKTTLLDEFSKNKKSLFLFASDSDDETIRKDFSKELLKKNGVIGAKYDSWDSFFNGVSSYFGDDYGVMIIDEYPNIVLTRDGKRKKTDFVSKLQNAIDRVFKNQKFVLILTGSNVSFIEKEVNDTKAPLYERNTFQLMLGKLEWNDALIMLQGMNKIDAVKTMCLVDTFPFYLSNIDTSISFDENINNLFFKKDSLFVNDPSQLITSDISTSGLYSGIMRKISSGCNTISDLAHSLGTDTATISVYLDKLIENKIISKHYMFNSKRITYYKIIDRIAAFYFRFVLADAEKIKLGYGELIRDEYKNAIDDFVHHSFEELCITYLCHLTKIGKLDGLYFDYQNYKVENSQLNRSIEIDIVSEYKKRLLVGECKMTSNAISLDVLEKMKENVTVPPFTSYSQISYYLFSTAGFSNSLIKCANQNVHLIDLEKMMEGTIK